MNTKLNFSDTGSVLSTSSHSLLVNDKSAVTRNPHSSIHNQFNITSDLESKVSCVCLLVFSQI